MRFSIRDLLWATLVVAMGLGGGVTDQGDSAVQQAHRLHDTLRDAKELTTNQANGIIGPCTRSCSWRCCRDSKVPPRNFAATTQTRQSIGAFWTSHSLGRSQQRNSDQLRTYTTNSWRAREFPMRFSIRDLLWAMLVVAMGLGWWNEHQAYRESDAKRLRGRSTGAR